MKRVEVAIIGASIAGASAACLLGRHGLSVALLDKNTFPRRKACGEGLSIQGIKALQRLSLIDEKALLSHSPFFGFAFHSHQTHILSDSDREPIGVGIPRSILDHLLLEEALKHSSVQPIFDAKDTTIDNDIVSYNDTKIQAESIVIADGSNSSMSKMLHIPTERRAVPRVGSSTIFRGEFATPPIYIHIFVRDGYEIYCTPLPEGELNVCILAPYPARSSLKLILDDELKNIFEILNFRGERSGATLGRAPIGWCRRKDPLDRVFLVGDAAEEFDPIAGMGMTHAILSGEAAALAILEGHKLHSGKFDVVQHYTMEREALARPLRAFTSLVSLLVRNGEKYPVLFKLASSSIGRQVTRAMHEENDNQLTRSAFSLFGSYL